MIVYQSYDTMDMAGSDAWHPTLAKAVAHVRQVYGVKGPVVLDDDGEWQGESEDVGTVYISRHNIETTREGLCRALQHLPMR